MDLSIIASLVDILGPTGALVVFIVIYSLNARRTAKKNSNPHTDHQMLVEIRDVLLSIEHTVKETRQRTEDVWTHLNK